MYFNVPVHYRIKEGERVGKIGKTLVFAVVVVATHDYKKKREILLEAKLNNSVYRPGIHV